MLLYAILHLGQHRHFTWAIKTSAKKREAREVCTEIPFSKNLCKQQAFPFALAVIISESTSTLKLLHCNAKPIAMF